MSGQACRVDMNTSGHVSAFVPLHYQNPLRDSITAPADAPISRAPQAGSTSSLWTVAAKSEKDRAQQPIRISIAAALSEIKQNSFSVEDLFSERPTPIRPG